jgi:hypothetical protein
MANIQYFAKPPSRNAGTNRVTRISATRIAAGQTRRARKAKADGLRELDSAGAALAWSLIIEILPQILGAVLFRLCELLDKAREKEAIRAS